MTPSPSEFSNARGIAKAINGAVLHLMPPPNMKPSEWAEANIRIPIGNAVPGPMRMDNAPYQREPMDMLVHPDCYRISLQWGAQLGKTMLALAIQAYCIGLLPRSQMMLQPSQGDLHTWLETKFNPLIEGNPPLRRLIAKPRGRDGVNNRQMKSYPGGFLMFAWSGSPKTMRGRSAPLIIADETDGYEVTEEGHPVGLIWQRAATFGDQRFLVEISTPTIKGSSYIESAFEAGDQRRFHVCCPDCGHSQTLKWDNVTWIGRGEAEVEELPDTARYACADCGSLWDDGQRIAAIRKGVWIAAKPFKGHASYQLNEMYSTFRRLRDIVQSYLDKIATNDEQTFINVSMAETYEEKGEQADATGLEKRREVFRAVVPMGGVYLTAGVDMQQDRLEVEIVAWGVGEESWSVDYTVLWGDPLQADVWEDLTEHLAQTFQHESKAELAVSSACLDTGGTSGYTQAAYDYAKGKTGRRLFAIKGGGSWGSPIVAAPSRKQSGKNARKVDLFIVGVDEAKLTVMRRLNVMQYGPGFCHFPEDRDSDYFKQLTAEKLVTRYVKGFPVREWRKGDRDRNEALDCRVYAFAALKITNPNLKRLSQKMGIDVTAPTPDKPAEATAEWSKRVADTAVKMRDVMIAVQESTPAPVQEEMPPEEAPAPPPQNRRIKRSPGLNKRKGWVQSY